MRYLRLGVAVLALAIVAVIAGALAYRAFRQHQYALTLAVPPAGIDERLFVPINGIEQFVAIRGEDRRNPVVLFLAGGPGNTLVPLAPVFRAWEKHFTLVQWDQRGTAKTLERNGTAGQGRLTIQQSVDDGIVLTEFLRAHLAARKVIVLGHSWGTILGVRMVKAAPGLFAAYVGTGQVVDKEEKEAFVYAALMRKLKAAGDAEAIAELKRVGPPPYRSQQDLLVERHISLRYDTPAERDLERTMAPVVLFAPDYSLCDIYYAVGYGDFAADRMYEEIARYDARELGPDFEVPMFVFNGDRDAITPSELVPPWFDTIRAPKKAFVSLAGGGHSALLTMSDEFLEQLLIHVRPVVLQEPEMAPSKATPTNSDVR